MEVYDCILVGCFTLMMISNHTAKPENWTATVFVGDKENGGSTGTFFLDVNGTDGSSRFLVLGNNFTRKQPSSISFIRSFGDITSIRIFQYCSDGLFVDKVVLSDGVHDYNFSCSCWIDTDQTGVSSWTLYPSSTPETWIVTLFVGDIQEADSSATIFLDVNGTARNGRYLSLGNNFVRNQQSNTSIAKSFGAITSIRIFQFCTDGVFVDRVVLSNGEDYYNFSCSCWIETDDAGVSSWTLYPSPIVEDWTITVFVGTVEHAESASEFFLDVNGTSGSDELISLGKNFANGEERDMIVKEAAWGTITSIRFFQESDDGLFLIKVVLSNGKESYSFSCNCWVDTDGSNTPSLTLFPDAV